MHQTNRYLRNLLILLSLLFLVVNGSPIMNIYGQEILLTIADEQVTEEEFVFFMKPLRAFAYGYFYRNYTADQGPEFWTTSYSGEIPVQYIRERTIDKLTEVKINLLLAREMGMLEDISFGATTARFNEENKRRSDALENGEVIYGPQEFSMETYFSFWFSNLIIRVRREWGNRSQVNQDSVNSFYQHHLDDYRISDELLITEISIPFNEEVTREMALDEARELISGNENAKDLCNRPGIKCRDFPMLADENMEAEGYIGEMYGIAKDLLPGQVGGPIIDSWNGQIVVLVCKDRKEGYIEPLDEIRIQVVSQYKNEQFQKYMQDRMNSAEINILSHDINATLLKYLK